MMSMQVRQQANRFKTGLINLCSSARTVIPLLHQVMIQENNRFKTGLINLCSSARTVIPPLHQVMIQVHSDTDISLTTGKGPQPSCGRHVCLIRLRWLTSMKARRQSKSPTRTTTRLHLKPTPLWHISVSQHHTRCQASRSCQWST